MKSSFLAIIFATGLLACQANDSHSSATTSATKEETPEALQGSDMYELKNSMRGKYEDNLVDELYEEVVSKDLELRALEKALEMNARQKEMLQQQFTRYDNKSSRYYSSADRLLSSLQDSLLKQKMQLLINANQQNYSSQTSSLQQLLAASTVKSASIEEYHTVLKITKTLPFLATYQKNHLPSAKPYQELKQKLDTTFTHIQKKITQ